MTRRDALRQLLAVPLAGAALILITEAREVKNCRKERFVLLNSKGVINRGAISHRQMEQKVELGRLARERGYVLAIEC